MWLFYYDSEFYEPEALLSDPADGRIFIELLGKWIYILQVWLVCCIPANK